MSPTARPPSIWPCAIGADIVATNTKGASIAPESAEELHKLLLSRQRALGSSEIVAVADDKGDVITGSDDWQAGADQYRRSQVFRRGA